MFFDIIMLFLVEEKSLILVEVECVIVCMLYFVIMLIDEFKFLFFFNKLFELDVFSELEFIMCFYDLFVEDLFFKWDVYCIKMGIEMEVLIFLVIRNLK